MSEELVITSAANPRLKALTALRRRRTREEQGRTLVEGFEEVELALAAGVTPQVLYHCLELMSDPVSGQQLLDRAGAQGAELVRLGRVAFEKVAYREGPDGILAVVASAGRGLDALELPDNALLLVCEAVEKPGNLGAMLRTADAAGTAAVVAADPVTDWGNPNLVRASKGTVFALPVASGSTADTVRWLGRHGIPLVATTPDTDTHHTDVDYTGPVAVAVGAEKHGLSQQLLGAAQHRVRIPMAGRADSLNVATSAAIVLYEAVRQRRGGPR